MSFRRREGVVSSLPNCNLLIPAYNFQFGGRAQTFGHSSCTPPPLHWRLIRALPMPWRARLQLLGLPNRVIELVVEAIFLLIQALLIQLFCLCRIVFPLPQNPTIMKRPNC